MIGHLQGTLFRKTPQEIILDCGGIGFHVLIPTSTYKKLPDTGVEVQLEIVTMVGQDEITLAGFLTNQEKDLFNILKGVTRIGTKLALTIIGGITPADFVLAITTRDAGRLAALHGIGKKTAERLIIECRDKLSTLQTDRGAESIGSQFFIPEIPEVQIAFSALMNLGYRQVEAVEAIKRALSLDPPPQGEQELIRAALRQASSATTR